MDVNRYFLSITLGTLMAGEVVIIALLLELLRVTNVTGFPPVQ